MNRFEKRSRSIMLSSSHTTLENFNGCDHMDLNYYLTSNLEQIIVYITILVFYGKMKSLPVYPYIPFMFELDEFINVLISRAKDTTTG